MSGPLNKEKIEQLAPDQASLSAALKLLKPGNWPTLGADPGNSLLWGECQGSGSTPYRICLATADLGYKCTCPSRKFPCKHVLALMWQFCDAPGRFPPGASPEWVDEWLSRRRGKSAARTETAPGDGRISRGGSIAAALAESPVDAAPDPKAAARAEAQSLRRLQEREASVLEGVANLELWIADQLNHGLAGFAANAAKTCRAMAARLVDAKAAGLGALLDQLAADVFRVPDAQRSDLVMERLAALALLAASYRRQQALPAGLRADVRRTVGWTIKRAELLADASALRVAAPWMVIAARSEIQPDKLRRLETWLMRLDEPPTANGEGDGDGARPRFALLLDYVPVSDRATALPFRPGELLLAEIVFYPSAAPLRAQIGASESVPCNPAAGRSPWPAFPASLDQALDSYERALALQPWLEAWPVAACRLHLEPDETGGLMISGADGAALPVNASQSDFAAPLLAFDDFTAAGLWDGRTFTLFAADTPFGLWRDR